MENKTQIKSFRDLEVYQESYSSMLKVFKELLPLLPLLEKFDLKDQLSRSTKAVPRLIAEGYAKRHQKMGFQKYLDDAMAEANETVVGIEMCKDLFGIDVEPCNFLIDKYDKIGRQLYNLATAWSKFKNDQRNP